MTSYYSDCTMASCSDAGVSSRFLSLKTADRNLILTDRNKKNTQNATKLWKNLIDQYILEKELGANLEAIEDDKLPELLEQFYADIRTKKDHDRYKNSSLRAIRAGINRFIKESRSIDIIADKRFIRANELFKGVAKQNKQAGKGTVNHKSPILSEDLEKLQDYFSKYMQPNATVLQRCVLFNLMFFLCRRGRENLTTMKRDTFEVTSWSMSMMTFFVMK